MDAKTLRASILQMAIEGKLVPQLDEEPTVEQIGDAPEEVPFEIPGKWKWIAVGKLLSQKPQNGKSSKASDMGNGTKILTLSATTSGVFRSECFKFCNLPLPINPAWWLKNNDVLIQRSNTREYVGTACLYQGENDQYVFPDLMIRLSSDQTKVLPEYLVVALNSPYGRNYFMANASGTSQTMPKISQTTITSLDIPVPSVAEQRRIVARLNELLPLVDKFGKAQEALAVAQKEFPEKLKASLLQEAIQGKLVPQLDEEPAVEQIGDVPEDVPFAIPEKWKWVQCDEVVTFNPRIQAQDETEASFIPMPAVSAGFTSTIDTSAIKHWKQIKNGFSKFSDGDVLFAKITPCFQNRKSVVCKNLSNGIGAGSTEFHVLRPSEKLLSDFLLFFLKSPYLIKYGMENLRGTAGQQRFSTADLKACLFPLPPIEEQRRIVVRLNDLLPLVTKMAAATAN